MEVNGDVYQLEISNCSVSRNGRSLDLFKKRGSWDRCRKKVVKDAGIFCGNLCVGSSQHPPCQKVWYRYCYVKYLKDDLPKSWNYSRGDWKGELEGGYYKRIMGDHVLTHFQCDLCHF